MLAGLEHGHIVQLRRRPRRDEGLDPSLADHHAALGPVGQNGQRILDPDRLRLVQ